jgi:dipeptidyl aminopeptidase/acylaminoacyl peptidase
MESVMKQLSFFCILVASVAFSQKQPFTLDDLYRIKDVSDPRWSPDGKRIASVMSESNLHQGKSNQELYIMDADGGNRVRMTNNPSADFSPRWSPDGKTILFLSSRKGGVQAWLIPVGGGEARQVTSTSGGVASITWLPDGKRFVYTSEVYPEHGADDNANKKISSSAGEGPLQAYLSDKLFYRHWDSWKEGMRTHTFVFDIDRETSVDLTPGDFDSPSMTATVGYDVSPDGKEFCFVSNRTDSPAENTNNDLWIAPVGGGVPVNITRGNPGYDGDPAYSPDGRYIAYRIQTTPRFESDRFRVALYDRKTTATAILTDAFDNWVIAISWAPDSRAVYFRGEVEGHVPLFRVELEGRKIDRVADVKTIDDFDVSPDGKAIAFSRRSVGEPREIWRTDRTGKKTLPLTDVNRALSDTVDIRPAEELWIPSPTGKKIHTFIVKPHDFDPSRKYPLILNVHGGPQSQWADAFRGDWQVYPGAGYIVAFPNPHGSTGYGQEFTSAISRDWAGKVYDDVMAVADSLSRVSWVDKDRMGAMGWSYGGYMMMWLEGHTDRFRAIACMMGVYNLTAMHGATEELWFPEWDLGGAPWESDLYEKWSPNRFVRNFKTPCLVITGEKDFRVPYTQSLEFFTDLQKMNVPSRLIVFKNDGHWPSTVKSMPFYYNAHLDWFHTYLGGLPAPYDMQKMVRNQAYVEGK